MEVIFNGPMRSGIVLDSQKLLNQGYSRFQRELVEKLMALYLGEWICPDFRARRNNMTFDVDSFQGETIIPRYLICRSFTGEDLEGILDEFHLEAKVQPPRENPGKDTAPPLAYFVPDKMDIYLYDYGYASCVLRGRVTANIDLEIEEYRNVVESISSALPDYTELFHSTIAKVAKAIPPEFITLTYHQGTQAGAGGDRPVWPNMSLGQHIGELFWVHRLFLVPCRDNAEYLRVRHTARILAYTPKADDLIDVSQRADMAVYPGNGNSCAVYIAEDTPEAAFMTLKAVIRAQNVFYAALQDLDRDLFYLNNEGTALHDTREMEALERHMRYMSETLSRTGFIKSVYDDYDNQLDPQSIAIWDHLRMVWIMGDMFRALDQKTAIADKAYDRAAQRLLALQSHQTGNLIAIFLVIICILGALPALSEHVQRALGSIVLAFALGAATLLTVRYFRTK